jgi:hypothetical protein
MLEKIIEKLLNKIDKKNALILGGFLLGIYLCRLLDIAQDPNIIGVIILIVTPFIIILLIGKGRKL